jgi:hypothetical protein
MSLDDTLERPRTSDLRLGDGDTNWVTLGTCPQMASMNNYPVAMQLNGVTYVISGGDGGNTVLTSADDGVTWNPPQTGDWPVRKALSGALHGGKFYIVGGFSPGEGFGDTLVSDDCLHFTQAGPMPAPWGLRWAHTLLSTGDKLLMIAGVSGPDYSNEVWALGADDTWTLISQGQFTKRAWAAGAVLGSKLLVIGGWNEPDGAFAETLVSDDGGVTWTVNKAPFTPRHSAAAVTIGDTVYLVGGCTGRPGTTFYNDTWATKDGVLWTRLDHSFGPIGRTFAAVPLGGQIGVIGTSANIIGLAPPAAWTELAPDPGCKGVCAPATGKLNGRYYAFGGQHPENAFASDTGITWTPTPLPQFGRRQNMAGTVHHGKLILCAGDFGGPTFNDVYVSTDGVSWTQVAGSQRFAGSAGRCVASFLDKLWVFGGDDTDVWSSEDDGVSWQLENPNAFEQASGFLSQAIVFAGKLWMIDGDYQQNWSTANGINWDRHDPPWSSRTVHRLEIVGETLYLIRGFRSPNFLHDVWATVDGLNWRLVETQAPLDICQFGTIVVDDSIILFGGTIGTGGRYFDSDRILRYLPPQLPPPA